MALTIPPAANYPSGLQAQPSYSQDEPKEGRKQIAAEITWANMGGANKCVAFNADTRQPGGFTQISSLKVDNSKSGADVTFIFPDTQETIVIPAQTPLAVVPVFSNSLQFFVTCPTANSDDVTRFVLLNYALDPAGVDLTEAGVFVASTTTLWPNSVVLTQLVPAGTSGTLQLFQHAVVQNVAFNATPSTGGLQIRDGNGNIAIPSWKIAGGSYTPISLPSMDWRFQNGLIAEFTPLTNWVGQLWAMFALTYRVTR